MSLHGRILDASSPSGSDHATTESRRSISAWRTTTAKATAIWSNPT
jgi:hypothetical protein